MLKEDGEEWTVSKLRKLLGKHIEALEMAGGEPRSTQNPVKFPGKISQREGTGHSYLKSTAGGLLAGSGRSVTATRQHSIPMKCIYCSENHWSDECFKFTTLQARRDKLKDMF